MIYEDENHTKEDLEKLRRTNRCRDCGSPLNVYLDTKLGKAFLACWDWHRTYHDGGYERQAVHREFNIPTRREMMNHKFGTEKTKALEKYSAPGGVITKPIATQIVETLWGDAPAIEKAKAIMICHQYNLNPLVKHLHMVGYRRRDSNGNFIKDKNGEYVLDWSIMQGIGATRLIAHRKHNFTYLDLTPRRATQEEIDKILGDTADPKQIYGFTNIRDLETGAESFGLRGYLAAEKVKGADKGNSPLNMACIRSERLAIDRLYPGEMPEGIDVIDERFVDTNTGEILEVVGGEHPLSMPEGDEKTGEPTSEPDSAIENQDLELGEGEIGSPVFSAPKGEEKPKKIGASPANSNARDLDKKMLYSAAGKMGWTQQHLSKELRDRTGTGSIDKIPDEQLHEVASILTDLAEFA